MNRHLCVLILGLCGTAAALAAPTVQIKEASVYARPTPTAKFLGRLPLGTVLTVVATQDDWAQVKTTDPPLSGWIRTQAFTVREAKLQAGGQTQAVSGTEVSLAGRGFTESVETGYRQANPNLDYAPLDRMEAFDLSDDELSAFLSAGGLRPAGGAR